MSDNVMVMVGTRKGAFIMESASARKDWKVRGPYLEGQNVMHMAFDRRTGTTFAAVGDPWFGSRVYRSTDQGRTWDEPQSGPVFPEGTGLTLDKVWHVEPGRPEEPGVVYAGVAPAALFKSTDNGDTWELNTALNSHPTRSDWQPGAGGLCLHTIVLDPVELQRIYLAISAVGVFRSTDGGASWQTANKGTRTNFMPDQPPTYPEWGQCVHKVVLNPSMPKRLYQQNHCGVYRSDDGADQWTEITEGLSSDWGFGISVHPHDPDTIWVCPGTSGYKHWVPDGSLAVYRTRDEGKAWERLTVGLPQKDAYVIVLREGMAVDALQTAGLYIGTNTGQLYYSNDEGDSWHLSDALFPGINSVGTATL
ncbi:MAG TPA: exo-alpha-sialidase [Dehalococcoidia bacterium]|nr:exo-alpha-sialidase [Dehalococcoidia bacterium]